MDIFVFVFKGEIKCIICTSEISPLWLGFSTSMCHQLLYHPNGSGAAGKKEEVVEGQHVVWELHSMELELAMNSFLFYFFYQPR